MRPHEARRLAAQFNEQFMPTRQTDNLDVIANLSPATNSSKVLADVAKWHERRRGMRHRLIAQALRLASGTQPAGANDNQRRRRAA